MALASTRERLALYDAGRYIQGILASTRFSSMIKSFKDKQTETIASGQAARKLPLDIQRNALKKLRQLAAATTIEDLRIPPGNRLEALKGNRTGQYSMRINDQWRICFCFEAGDAFEVEIVDYH